MADVFSKKKRSQVMARIRSRGNAATELALAKLFRRHQITGWRRHVQLRIANEELRMREGGGGKIRTLKFGIRHFKVRPDFIFPQFRLAVFVDGCFWHGCPRHGTQPKGNAAFWRKKISGNRTRDRLVTRTLRRGGWKVIRIWECTLKKHSLTCLRRIQRALAG